MNEVLQDLPRCNTAETIPGTQPKFIAWKIDRRLMVGPTVEDRCERWEVCEDLAQ